MPALTAAIGAIGLISALGGGVMSYMGNQAQIHAAEDANNIQKQQMLLDDSRNKRNIARQAIVMRGQALSAATNQGAGYGASSGLAGGLAGVSNQANSAYLGANQNTLNASALFDARQRGFEGESEAATGGAISSFGSTLMNLAPTIGKLGGYYGLPGMGTNTWGGSPSITPDRPKTGWGMSAAYI